MNFTATSELGQVFVQTTDHRGHTVEEIADVLRVVQGDPMRRSILAVAIYAGLRKGELWQMRWRNVDLDGDHPEARVRGQLKSESSERTVPLLPPAVAALRAWKATQDAARAAKGDPIQMDPLVWPSDSGGVRREDDDATWGDRPSKARDGSRRVTPGIKARAGIERRVRFHDLRHTCASHLVQGSWGAVYSLEEVRQWMGHSTIGVTQRYAHMSPQGLRAKAAAMRQIMGTPVQEVAQPVALPRKPIK